MALANLAEAPLLIRLILHVAAELPSREGDRLSQIRTMHLHRFVVCERKRLRALNIVNGLGELQCLAGLDCTGKLAVDDDRRGTIFLDGFRLLGPARLGVCFERVEQRLHARIYLDPVFCDVHITIRLALLPSSCARTKSREGLRSRDGRIRAYILPVPSRLLCQVERHLVVWFSIVVNTRRPTRDSNPRPSHRQCGAHSLLGGKGKLLILRANWVLSRARDWKRRHCPVESPWAEKSDDSTR